MSKFLELCGAYRQAQLDFEDYRHDCVQFAIELWDNLIQYFEIPLTQICLYQANEEDEFEPINPPMFNALTLREDSYWQVGFGLTLYKEKDCFPQETLVIGLNLKRNSKEEYVVKIAGSEEEFSVDRQKIADFHRFYDHVFKLVQESYAAGIHKFIDQDATERPIGFKIGAAGGGNL